jgi:DNA-binding MarR family transcriptional regulator
MTNDDPPPRRRGTSHRPAAPAPTVDDDQVQRLLRAIESFTVAQRRLIWRYKRGNSLSSGRLRALGVLLAEGRATHGQLVVQAELNPASTTAMIEQLEAQGIVERQRDERDRRVWWISLTDHGRTEVINARARWDHRLADALADSTSEDLATACDVLERVISTFDSVPDDDL